MTRPHRVLVIGEIHRRGLDLFDRRDDVEYTVLDDPAAFDQARRLVVDADAVTVRAAPLSVELLASAPNLKIVSRHGVGYDNVPVEHCTSRGIPVTVVGSVNAVAVAEHTMLLMLAATRSAVLVDQAVRRGDFAIRNRVVTAELQGRTLLIVGYGRIGREVARRAEAFDMNIAVYDPWLSGGLPERYERVTDLRDGLGRAQIVSLHLPLSDETRNLLDADALDLLPEGAIVVNAARGGLLDEQGLADRVASGRLFGAGLDVFDEEPLPTDSPLVSEPRVVLSPHNAALTEETLLAMGTVTAQNVLDAFDGSLDPSLVVNPTVLDPD